MFELLSTTNGADEEPVEYSRFDLSLEVIENILLKKLRQNKRNEMVKF